MGLIKWSKVAKLIAPNINTDLQDFLLVYTLHEQAGPIQKSNYNYLQSQINDLKILEIKNKKYLLLPPKSNNLLKAQNLVSKISEVEILDEVSYTQELSKDQENRKNLGQCSLCSKPLNDENSVLSSMGPVCEHKARLIESGKEPLEKYQAFKPLGAINPKKGESLILKIKVNNKEEVKFVEIVDQKNDCYEVIDRKKMSQEINAGKDVHQSLQDNFYQVPIKNISGALRVAESSQTKNEPNWMDEVLGFFGDNKNE